MYEYSEDVYTVDLLPFQLVNWYLSLIYWLGADWAELGNLSQKLAWYLESSKASNQIFKKKHLLQVLCAIKIIQDMAVKCINMWQSSPLPNSNQSLCYNFFDCLSHSFSTYLWYYLIVRVFFWTILLRGALQVIIIIQSCSIS